MMDKNKQIRLCVILLIFNLSFIWGNSLLPAEISQALSDWALEILEPASAENLADAGSGLLRKAAHFAEFTALGLLLSRLLMLLEKKCSPALLYGAAAACLDEFIQCFVPGRAPGIPDVGIDTCGVLTGILFLQIGRLLLRRKQLKQYGGKP